ncbi:hypothetical protein RMATCC62417_13857 [Rhizopus microsporus]|nr:hypothetical protein RMATCC62417_13857 [Rhizopus microsporus]
MTFVVLVLAYAILASLFYVEYHYKSRTTTTLQTAGDDRGTTRLLLLSYLIAITTPLVCLLLLDTTTAMSDYVKWTGLGIMLSAIFFLRWATTVNPFYLPSLSTTDDQFICTDGPYKLIRHPGYCAFIVAWFGFGLTTGSWIAFFIIFLLLSFVYLLRIQAEEQMMLDRFGVDYQQYMNETYRIIPYVY